MDLLFPSRNAYLSLEAPIKINKKGESAGFEFNLSEKRNYDFMIRFKAANEADAGRLRKLLGDPGYHIYTKESVKNHHPEPPPKSSVPEDLWVGVRSGEYVAVPDNSGQIPVRIVISNLEQDGSSKPVVDKDVNTVAYFAHGRCSPNYKNEELCFYRNILWSGLSPGRYRIQVTTLDDTPRFDGVDARITIGFNPKVRN